MLSLLAPLILVEHDKLQYEALDEFTIKSHARLIGKV
jgi:hypothetical protein